MGAIRLAVVALALVACNSKEADPAPEEKPAPAKAAPPAPPAKPPTITTANERGGYEGKKRERVIRLEQAAANAVISWCGRDGKLPFWRGDFTADATYIDDKKANLVNVYVDHVRKQQLVDGNVLPYMIRFKDEKPVAITAGKRQSALACRELEPDVEAPLE